MGLYVGDTRVAPVIMATPIYRGSYNIVTDLGLTTDSSQSDIITALENEISTPQYANYCFVDIPYANYSEVSGYDQFTTTSDYVGYYVLVGDVYTLVTDDNKDSLELNIDPGTTVAYSVSYTSYFEKIQRYRYNGNSWEYEYDVDFSGYANVDASNFTDSGTTFLSGLGMPSNRYETLTVGTSGADYTAPANGIFYASVGLNQNGQIRLQNRRNFIMMTIIGPVGNASNVQVFVEVLTGDIVRLSWSNTYQSNKPTLMFFYAEGNPTPPQP